MATNGNLNHQDQYTGPTMPAPNEYAGSTGATARDHSKDEVGWYFVEQYYTTLSKNPEKLHVRTTPPLHAKCVVATVLSTRVQTSNAPNSFSTAKSPNLSTGSKQTLLESRSDVPYVLSPPNLSCAPMPRLFSFLTRY